MTATIDILLTQGQIDTRIKELAEQISTDYNGEDVTFLITLKGAVYFGCKLSEHMTVPTYLEFIQTSSYSGIKSTDTISLKLDVEPQSIVGKNIIIIEDVIDTGRTLKYLKAILELRKPKTLKICSLLDKHDHRVVELEGDYVGFSIGNDFVVGYGLDIDQKFRNLPFIGIVQGYTPSDETYVLFDK
ncbi:MAG TPA: hypoxanthine phosphoribosyltransferase [Methanocorpusculum sp.]|nr:hypoxanthine phosphoribosyltransferase [Methanocorpusculum sp.]